MLNYCLQIKKILLVESKSSFITFWTTRTVDIVSIWLYQPKICNCDMFIVYYWFVINYYIDRWVDTFVSCKTGWRIGLTHYFFLTYISCKNLFRTKKKTMQAFWRKRVSTNCIWKPLKTLINMLCSHFL